MWLYTQTHSNGENKFFFASDCELETTSWWGMGVRVHSPLRTGDLSGLDLCTPCACCHSPCGFTGWLLKGRNTVLQDKLPPTWPRWPPALQMGGLDILLCDQPLRSCESKPKDWVSASLLRKVGGNAWGLGNLPGYWFSHPSIWNSWDGKGNLLECQACISCQCCTYSPSILITGIEFKSLVFFSIVIKHSKNIHWNEYFLLF